MPTRKLLDYLNNNHIKYVTIHHSKGYTAMEIAHAAHILGANLAKTVMILIDGKLAMCVLPATYKVNISHLKSVMGVSEITIATEKEFAGAFPGCEVGAMPPFGNLYGLDVYVDATLTRCKEISFNAGYLTELLRMDYKDFDTLVKPRVVDFV